MTLAGRATDEREGKFPAEEQRCFSAVHLKMPEANQRLDVDQDAVARRWQPDLHWLTDSSRSAAASRRSMRGRLRDEHGISAVVDLRGEACDDEAALGAAGIDFLHLPTPDLEPASVAMLWSAGVGFVREQIARGGKVLIHCQHGIGRSALLALCVLVDQGWAPLDALIHAKDRSERISPSRSQYQGWARWLDSARDCGARTITASAASRTGTWRTAERGAGLRRSRASGCRPARALHAHCRSLASRCVDAGGIERHAKLVGAADRSGADLGKASPMPSSRSNKMPAELDRLASSRARGERCCDRGIAAIRDIGELPALPQMSNCPKPVELTPARGLRFLRRLSGGLCRSGAAAESFAAHRESSASAASARRSAPSSPRRSMHRRRLRCGRSATRSARRSRSRPSSSTRCWTAIVIMSSSTKVRVCPAARSVPSPTGCRRAAYRWSGSPSCRAMAAIWAPQASAAHGALAEARSGPADFGPKLGDLLRQWAEPLIGPLDRRLRDISGGGWRPLLDASEAEWPPVVGGWERRKFLAEASGERYLVKFAGLGAIGASKLAMARALYAEGLTPEPLGLAPWASSSNAGGRRAAAATERTSRLPKSAITSAGAHGCSRRDQMTAPAWPICWPWRSATPLWGSARMPQPGCRSGSRGRPASDARRRRPHRQPARRRTNGCGLIDGRLTEDRRARPSSSAMI